jgi:hypothetical protein
LTRMGRLLGEPRLPEARCPESSCRHDGPRSDNREAIDRRPLATSPGRGRGGRASSDPWRAVTGADGGADDSGVESAAGHWEIAYRGFGEAWSRLRR